MPNDERQRQVPRWLDTAAAYSWRVVIITIAILGALWLLARLYLVTLPIVVAVILATLLAPPTRRLEERGLRPALATAVTVIGSLALLLTLLALLAPSMVDQLRDLGPTVSDGFDKILQWAQDGPLGLERERIDDLIRQVRDSASANSGRIVSGVLSGAVLLAEGVASTALMLVLLFFFVKDGPDIIRWAVERTPPDRRETVMAIGSRAWVALGGYVRGTALIALIDAVGIGIGLWVFGVPLVLPLTFIVFLGGFIPVIGAFVAGLIAVVVALAGNGLGTALLTLVWILLFQQLEGHILQPTIMRRAVALHPVVILGALTSGAALAGIAGAFLSVPIAAVISAIGNELRVRWEDPDTSLGSQPDTATG